MCYHAVFGEILFLVLATLIVLKLWKAKGTIYSRIIMALIMWGIVSVFYLFLYEFFLMALVTGMYSRELGTCPADSEIVWFGIWGLLLPLGVFIIRALKPSNEAKAASS